MQPRPDDVWNTDETGSLIVELAQVLPGSLCSSVQQNTTVVRWFPVQQCATAQHVAFPPPFWAVCDLKIRPFACTWDIRFSVDRNAARTLAALALPLLLYGTRRCC